MRGVLAKALEGEPVDVRTELAVRGSFWRPLRQADDARPGSAALIDLSEWRRRHSQR